ncbi:hypothetical protein JL720_7285 [Aureococcus anophagefferens]|nr:hypothetical protein JL720_7285 [Aureococcus anophagefferens]
MNYDGLGVDDDMKLNHMIRMMENLRVPQTLKKPAGEILPFVYDIKMVMRDNSYHNFTHVTDVTQYMYTLLLATHVAERLRPVELAAAYIAAVCHDLDHPGLSNTYQNNENTELSKRYNKESPLENHHLSVFGRLCEKHELLANLPTEEEKTRFVDIVHHMILATDMAKHGLLMKKIKEKLNIDGWHPLKSEEGHQPHPPDRPQIYVAIMKRCAMMDEQVDAQAVEECLVFLQKNKERYQLQADGQYVDQDEEEDELQNFAVDLRTKIKSKEEEEEEKTKSKYPGINGLQQQDTIRILMNKIKQHSKHPPEPKFQPDDLFSEEMEGAAPPPDDGGGCVDLGEIAVLIDQLKNEDVRLRLESNANLLRIARALGPERVREELVPFICDLTDDSDDVLFEMADQLGSLGAYVGGPAHAHVVLEPLEALAAVEEARVRDRAVRAALEVAAAMPDESLVSYYVPFVQRLGNHDWFTARISACGLFAGPHGRLPGRKRVIQLRFNALARDDQDSVRLQTVGNCAALFRALEPARVRGTVLPVLLATATDRGVARRVRDEDAALAALAPSIEALSRDGSQQVLPVLLALLRDANAEVRLNIISNLGPVHAVVGVDLLSQSLLPAIVDLADDAKWRVRGAIIEHVPLIADQLGVAFFDDALKAKCVGWLADDVAAIRIAATRNLRLLAPSDDPVANVRFNAAATLRKLAPRLQRHRAGAELALLKTKLRSLADDDGDVDVVAIASEAAAAVDGDE